MTDLEARVAALEKRLSTTRVLSIALAVALLVTFATMLRETTFRGAWGRRGLDGSYSALRRERLDLVAADGARVRLTPRGIWFYRGDQARLWMVAEDDTPRMGGQLVEGRSFSLGADKDGAHLYIDAGGRVHLLANGSSAQLRLGGATWKPEAALVAGPKKATAGVMMRGGGDGDEGRRRPTTAGLLQVDEKRSVQLLGDFLRMNGDRGRALRAEVAKGADPVVWVLREEGEDRLEPRAGPPPRP